VTTLVLPAGATAGSTRTLTLKYHGPLIGSGSLAEDFAGVSTFKAPSGWAARRSGRFYDLTPSAAEGCAFKVQVNNQPTLTTASTARQVAAALPEGYRKAALGRGSRAHGSWGADETSNKATATHRVVYAIGIIHLSSHLYDRLRVVATFDGSCSDDVVRNGDVTAQVQQIARTGTFSGRRLRS
jgi:hypothetical protein